MAAPSPIAEHVRRWAVCLLPRFVCAWLVANTRTGHWAPHLFGRIIGADAHYVGRDTTRPT